MISPSSVIQFKRIQILSEILRFNKPKLPFNLTFYSGNRTQPNINDVAATFDLHKITVDDLNEYLKWVDTPEFALTKHNDPTLLANHAGELAPYKPTLPTTSKSKSKKHQAKTNKEYLGYCEDPENKEILDRQSDEEFEYVYDYLPLMTRGYLE